MKPRHIDITGQRFGKLVAVQPVSRDDQGVRWELKCDCGKTHTARTNVLRLGNVKSCGCTKPPPKGVKRPWTDITGERFGKATVIGLSKRKGGGKRYWDCRCDCGNTFCARGTDLKAGNTKSCGCLRFKN